MEYFINVKEFAIIENWEEKNDLFEMEFEYL
jgi:hypothetical protein